jgi:glutathione S-transferase
MTGLHALALPASNFSIYQGTSMNSLAPQNPIKLYGSPLSGHVHRVRLFLSLLELPVELITVDLRAKENRQPAFLARNPFGEVPVIEDGELVLADSTAILVYLALKYDGDAKWLPRDPVGAAHVQRWLSMASGKVAYGPCVARLVKLFDAPLDYQAAQTIAVKLFDVLEHEFKDRQFALGSNVTIADIAAFSYIEHAPEGGISLEAYPNIRAWLDRVKGLPGFVAMPSSTIAAT